MLYDFDSYSVADIDFIEEAEKFKNVMITKLFHNSKKPCLV